MNPAPPVTSALRLPSVTGRSLPARPKQSVRAFDRTCSVTSMAEQPPLGFVLLTHDRPAQALRLVDRLNTMFDSPPIAWHHDFGQTPLDAPAGWSNVAFVSPHVPTQWGTFSLVEAVVRAMRLLYAGPDGPQWCAVLSGADYPIKPATRVLTDLDGYEVDAHIEVVEIKPVDWESEWEEDCANRYHTVRLGSRSPRRRSWNPLARRLLSPFTSTYHCYAGSNWFHVSADAVEAILSFYGVDRRLARHLAYARIPEECYFQTVLANTPGVRIRNRTWHYVDWPDEDVAHPRTLGLDDLDALRETPKHFARKLDLGACPELYDELDRMTG